MIPPPSKKDARVAELRSQIERLARGEAIIMGGPDDVEYISKKISKLRTKVPSLSSALDTLNAQLESVDPNLSTFAARNARERAQTVSKFEWNSISREGLQAVGILDAKRKKPFQITKDTAQEIITQRNLEDGVYTFKDSAKESEIYIVVKKGELFGKVFEPPAHDIGYLLRVHKDLKYVGEIIVNE